MRRMLMMAGAQCLVAAAALAGDWPEFRGPEGQGHSPATGLARTWDESTNITWKTPLPGRGWSSPSIRGNEIWLTTALDDGRSLRALCVARDSGTLVRDVEVFQLEEPAGIHQKNSHASPTPLLEGDRVYVHYGAHGTACLTTAGEIVWTTKFDYDHQHGPGGSPIVVDDLLILSCDGTDVQFVVALDKRTGQERWRTERDGAMAYSTPLLIEVDGQRQVVSVGGEWTIAYEPETGKELWRARYPGGYSNVPRPVYEHGLVFVSSGFNRAKLYAIRPDGRGDVTDTHVEWQYDRAVPKNPSPLVIGNELYMVSDDGIATCFDARTGTVHWQERLGGKFSASPVYADGAIYLLNEEAVTTVIAPGKTFEKLAENPLEGESLASLAIADQAIFLRTDSHLYRIEDPTRQ